MTIRLLIFAAAFVAEALTALIYFDYIYIRKSDGAKTLLYFCAGYLILFLLSRLNSPGLNVVAFFIVNLIILSQNYLCGIKSAVMHSAFLTVANSASELIFILAATEYVKDFTVYLYNLSALASLALFGKLLYFLTAVLSARLFTPNKDCAEEPSRTLLLCILPLASVVLAVSVIYTGISGELDRESEIMLSMGIMLLLLANIGILYIYNGIQKAEREKAALQVNIIRERAEDEYYKMLRRQYEDQRILIHDIKNHLTAVALMAERGEGDKIRDYIAGLYNLTRFKLRGKLCDHPVLNMILLRYSEYCAENNISFSCDVRSKSISFMDDASVTALFGNLLSNAVEAAGESEERFVELSVTKNERLDLALITVVNSCDIRPEKDADGNLLTRGDETLGHGYGTKSIVRVVDKYSGRQETRYDEEEKEFHCVICFRNKF